jgi:hypothetical protein
MCSQVSCAETTDGPLAPKEGKNDIQVLLEEKIEAAPGAVADVSSLLGRIVIPWPSGTALSSLSDMSSSDR